MDFYSYKDEQEALNDFLEAYAPQEIVKVPDKLHKNLKNKSVRICRFCGVSNNKNLFRKEAHSIPEFLGNSYLLNDFECDKCNTLFGTYETCFADYLIIERVISGTKGKKGTPELVQNKSEKFIKRNSSALNNKEIKVQGIAGSDIVIDGESEKIATQFKLSYIPINIYRSLLKMALSIIRHEDVKLYNTAVDFLFDSKYLDEFESFAKVLRYDVDTTHRVPEPTCILFKKRDLHKKIPMHFFFLYYENIIFCLPLPFNLLDVKVGCYDSMSFLIPPPLLFSPPLNEGTFQKEFKDLSSDTKSGQTTNVSLKVPIEKLLEFWHEHPSYDPEINVSELKLSGYIFAPKEE